MNKTKIIMIIRNSLSNGLCLPIFLQSFPKSLGHVINVNTDSKTINKQKIKMFYAEKKRSNINPKKEAQKTFISSKEAKTKVEYNRTEQNIKYT